MTGRAPSKLADWAMDGVDGCGGLSRDLPPCCHAVRGWGLLGDVSILAASLCICRTPLVLRLEFADLALGV